MASENDIADETATKVVAFVADQVGHNVDQLTLTTSLFGDLGVDGDDGFYLMNAFATTFNVDMREFRLRDHFGIETPFDPISLLFVLLRHVWRCGGSTPEERAGVAPIRIADLVAAARRKKWHRPTQDGND